MELLVAADDRTGALETAAALADRGVDGHGVPVTVWPDVDPSRTVTVVDLESRHLAPEDAARRAGTLPAERLAAHKIDSTLRGNWAVELVARHRSTGEPVLVVPALPELGRVCVDGVVLLDGRPVGELGDVRLGTGSSRPAEHLAVAGVEAVGLRVVADVESWLAKGQGIAVADAATVDEVEAIVGAWRSWNEPDLPGRANGARHVLAGTSSVIARAIGRRSRPSTFPTGAALVIVGSANAFARRQAAELVATGFDSDLVLVSAEPSGIVSHDEAAAAATQLVQAMNDRLSEVAVDVIVVVGGDTAAAVLGDDPVTVYGTVGAGTAWLRSPRYPQAIVTRAGGFGGRGALVDLVSGTLRP